jgi:hypothetical protein
MKHYFKYLISFALILVGCQMKARKIDHVEKHVITEIIRKNPVSIHDEISPRFRAVLSNGDTVPCTDYRQVGDTITYIYYGNTGSNNSRDSR